MYVYIYTTYIIYIYIYIYIYTTYTYVIGMEKLVKLTAVGGSRVIFATRFVTKMQS